MRILLVFLAIALVACGGPAAVPDSGVDLGTSMDLGRDGGAVDAPMATDSGADLGGPDMGCTTDGDGDGHRSIPCGGDDCDDTDPNRFPGNTETCDSGGRDEDCDPLTLGPDHDGDGFVSTSCCNRQSSGTMLCGSDCDDTTMDVSPSAPEVCDGLDDNCDGMIDEGVQLTFYRDVDGDHYGDSTMTRMGCSAPSGYAIAEADCNDGDPTIHPGAPELCATTVDDNCNGTINEGCACTTGDTQPCGVSDGAGGFLMLGICHPGTQMCVASTWALCMGNVNPVPETCNMLDDNCNGMTDEGVLTSFYADCDRDGYGASGSTPTLGCMMPGTPPTCPSGTGNWIGNNTDCDDTVASTHPAALETCNDVDDDCNTIIDGAPANTWCNGPALPPHTTTATCMSATSTCVATVCAGRYLDCTSAAGCETDGGSDPADCGACGHACAWGTCNAGACDDPVELAVGGSHRCARRASGRVFCWGSDFWGQLGDGVALSVMAEYPTPVAVSGLTDAIEITAGGAHACARRASGSVVCWGYAAYGQLGDGVDVPGSSTPVDVVGLTDAVQIEAGENYTCARRSSGAVVCWGDNQYGQLGDGTTTSHDTPAPVVGVTDAIALSASFGTTCVIRTGGSVTCWGFNAQEELGDVASHGSTCPAGGVAPILGDCSLTPVAVPGISDAVEVSVGGGYYNTVDYGGHVCARRAGGTVVCWGRAHEGQCGEGSSSPRCDTGFEVTPSAVVGVTNAVEISASEGFAGHTCARLADRTVSCWGLGDDGALGSSSGSSYDCNADLVTGLSDAVEIGTGGWAGGYITPLQGVSCARRATGAIVCWGESYGFAPSVVPAPP